MDKGILIGAEHELAARPSLPFVLFRYTTSVGGNFVLAKKHMLILPYQSQLFLHQILHAHLQAGEVEQAVSFAKHYENLVYFAHALEILLHTVVESEADADDSPGASATAAVLPRVIEFLDYFDVALDVVVGCARKTEMARWKMLFDIVGNPKTLFEVRSILL